MNEVFIRGMLVNRKIRDNSTTAVICSQSENKEHKNYQYVTFDGELKKVVDAMRLHEKVTVTARAWIYRNKETKAVTGENMRLHGESIETNRDFLKRVFEANRISHFGIRLIDCVRFNFSGKVFGIREIGGKRLSILLSVPETSRSGFNLIPLVYAGMGDPAELEQIMDECQKGQEISVKGFVSQTDIPADESTGDARTRHKNTYYITTFLSSNTDYDFENMQDAAAISAE